MEGVPSPSLVTVSCSKDLLMRKVCNCNNNLHHLSCSDGSCIHVTTGVIECRDIGCQLGHWPKDRANQCSTKSRPITEPSNTSGISTAANVPSGGPVHGFNPRALSNLAPDFLPKTSLYQSKKWTRNRNLLFRVLFVLILHYF